MEHFDVAWRRRAQHRWRATALLGIGVAFAVLSPVGARAAQPAACLYAYEWIHTFRFPLQPDPHGAYSFVVPKLPADGTPLGFLVEADFPYAAWFSWTIYGAQGLAVALERDIEITADQGSTNPFVKGAPVFAPSRHYRMLIVPTGATVAPSLAGIQNLLAMPTDVPQFAVAYRVQQAFAGYNLGGANGPTNTPFPSVLAINYQTGDTLDCSQHNAVPPTIGRLPTDTPNVDNLYGTATTEVSRGLEHKVLADVERLIGIPAFAALQPAIGWQFAPEIDPALVTFTRPPPGPGADVASIPPPDNCSGYLGARVDPRRIALIRLPHVASIFETLALDPNTTYPDVQSAYTSLTMYGADVGTYDPGDPDSASLADSELLPDATGGSTIVVWPRDHLPLRNKLFDYAHDHGWALIRGGRDGALTTANMFLRLKGANPDYYGGYTPVSGGRSGVPCYFTPPPVGSPPVRWTDLEKASDPMSFVASFQNLGNAAPQGVHCASTAEVLNGVCLKRLEAYIAKTGGKYFNPGDVPPP